MKLLAYDILYGSYESYDGVVPYQPTQLQFGLDSIRLRSAHLHTELENYFCLFVNGDNFTPYSTAYINGEKCNTT